MTNWEQREIFSRMERIIELLEKIAKNTNIYIGVDKGVIGEDKTVVVETIIDKDSSRKDTISKDRDEYKMYKDNGGAMKWNEWHSKKRGKSRPS